MNNSRFPVIDERHYWGFRFRSLTNRYAYQHLKPNEFRILDILPGVFDEELCCCLHRVVLPTNYADPVRSDYEALSYTWGDPGNRARIACSDGFVSITLNLHSALKHLRYADRPRYIWADAICIDQSNVHERGQQVQRMGQIYSNASRVIAWLGEESEDVKGALEVLPRWLSTVDPILDESVVRVTWYSQALFTFERTSNKQVNSWLEFQQRTWPRVMALMARPWWQRKWIIQELVLAREAVFVCGFSSVDWDAIFGIMSSQRMYLTGRGIALIMRQYPDHALPQRAFDGLAAAEDLAGCKVERCRPRELQSNRCTLQGLVQEMQHFQCSEQRDHLYGLLGIATDVNPLNIMALKVDYTASTEVISERFAVWQLHFASNPLGYLSAVMENRLQLHTTPQQAAAYTAQDDCRNLPTWAGNIVPRPRLERRDLNVRFSDLQYRAGFRHTKDRPCWSLSQYGRVLSLKGKIVDRVSVINTPFLDHAKASLSAHEQSNLMNNWRQVLKSYAGTAQHFDHMFHELVTFGGEEPWDAKYKPAMSFATFERLVDVVEAIVKGRQAPASLYRDETLMILQRQMIKAAYHRLCVTAAGRVGWMPQVVEAGDEICILYGGKVPCLISACGQGHYNMIGECYVSGLMFGEALDAEDVPDQDIALY